MTGKDVIKYLEKQERLAKYMATETPERVDEAQKVNQDLSMFVEENQDIFEGLPCTKNTVRFVFNTFVATEIHKLANEFEQEEERK